MGLIALRRLISFLIAIIIKYIIKNSNIYNLISYFTQKLILELQYIKKGLQEVRNLVSFLYILIKLTFFQGNSNLNKNKQIPKVFRRYILYLLFFLRFFLVLSQLKRFLYFLYFLYPLYYTIYNTAHAASRLWRYSSIYINPFQAA